MRCSSPFPLTSSHITLQQTVAPIQRKEKLGTTAAVEEVMTSSVRLGTEKGMASLSLESQQKETAHQ